MKKKADWIGDCLHKERHLLARKLASEGELATTRPKTRSASLEQWIRHYAKLGQLLGREDDRALFLGHSEADGQMMAVLSEDPLEVSIVRDGEGPPVMVRVYPKAFLPLLVFFRARDWLVTLLADRYHGLIQDGKPSDIELLERIAAEIAYQQMLLAWGACTPGRALPFAPEDRPDIPAPFTEATPTDLLRVHEAFIRVNVGQLQALDRLVAPSKGAVGERPSWSIFFGKLAVKMKVPLERLLRDQSLAAILATVKLASPDGEDAEELEEAGV